MARETIRTQTDGREVLRRLKALGIEATKRGGPVGKAVRAGAVVIVEEAKANVRRIVMEPNKGGGNESTGLLEQSIQPLRARQHKVLKGETYLVTVPRRKRYPISTKTPSAIPVATVGAMLEYETPGRQAMPWLRPAFHSKKIEAVKAMTTTVIVGIERLERKLGR